RREWVGVSHGWITAGRGQAGRGQVPHGRRGGFADAGVEDDRLSAGTHRRADGGTGGPVVPGPGACRARVPQGVLRRVRLSGPATLDVSTFGGVTAGGAPVERWGV